ncbi:MAG: glycine--tRNA ligase [Planctomycetota bacterium]|nr:MAG: glycine--tRNA ligase [Planctomycetota bacterium]
MQKLVSLCKRRGFIFQSSEIYGGLKSAYDYGPLGIELKRNIMNEWWKSMVYQREDVVGLDASIIMHPKVWQASGHLSSFTDPLVDCRNCKERFRADKAPQVEPGTEVEYIKGGKPKGEKLKGIAERGYVCPNCGSPDLSPERQFNLMFRTHLGPVDILNELVQAAVKNKDKNEDELKKALAEVMEASAVYLRPETAQAMFVQFLNVQRTMSMKIPFGIAQMGKSFRNEVTTEHFIFRSCEFEQMELEYFVEPGTQLEWLEYWKEERLKWYRQFANHPENFRVREHTQEELAHYADKCYDIEYKYPWGWDELEGVASRTDYDLKKHTQMSGQKLEYFDPFKENPKTGKKGVKYTPYVVEPAAGATRSVLVYLLDAYAEEEPPEKGKSGRTVLRLHPKLAPFKAAVLPLVKKDGLPELARKIVEHFFQEGLNARYDEQHSIGKRYLRHDEAGTPFCLTVDHQSLEDKQVTIRYRDSREQRRIPIEEALDVVKKEIEKET